MIHVKIAGIVLEKAKRMVECGHVIANYDWTDNTVTLTKGASETTLIPQLESSAKYLAWKYL